MKYLPLSVALITGAAVLAGCAGTHPRGISRVDDFDAIQVDQMVGNNVSVSPLQKVVLCLNARRESHSMSALTNVSVVTVTNAMIQAATNEVVSISTNVLVTTMTNLASAAGGPVSPLSEEAAAVAAATVTEGNAAIAQTNAGPNVALSTNVTASLAQNSSLSLGPSQRGANRQFVRTVNSQFTSQSNNLSISMITNLMVSAETNVTVTYSTNYSLTLATNVSVTATNLLLHDYFLYTELIPPPDFNLVPGESLVLLVDGVRYGLSPASTGTAMAGRRGFTTTVYRANAELLVAIANAREVRVRVRGATTSVERTLSSSCREHFKTFLVRYFTPPGADPDPSGKAPGSTASLRLEDRSNETATAANLR